MKNFIYTLIFLGLITASTYSQNTILGYKALINNSGDYNTAIGYKTLFSNTGGTYNTVLGSYSMFGNLTGRSNTAIGYSAMRFNNSGTNNVAIGRNSLTYNIIGSNNSALGYNALYNSRGSDNNAFGYNSLCSLTTGDENLASGYKAGANITSGSRNIIIGSCIYFKSISNYNIALGYRVGSSDIGDNNIIIGKKITLPGGTSNAMNIGGVLFGTGFQSGLPESASTSPANGRIGINVVNPSTTLEVGAANGEGIRIGKIGDIGNAAVSVGALSAQYNIDFTGYRDVALDQIGARISALRINCHIANSALVQKTGLAFSTNASGINTGTTDLVERMRITPEGFIGIGTTSPDALLTVNGTIHSKEVNVALTGPLADYVFDTNYKLMPLHEVEQFVNVNSHLPEMPSADEVSKNGLNMGEMQNKLLQKVEELTLYMIDQQKTINQQSAKIEELEKKLK